MKAKLMIVGFFLFFTVNGLIAQKYPSPDVKDVPFYFDEGKNTLTKLEHYALNIEDRHVGIWGSVEVIAIPGLSSNVKFSRNNSLQFIIRLEDDANPSALCELDAFETKGKGQREYIATKSGAHGAIKQASVAIKFDKVGPGLYLITAPKNIGQGEFFFKILTTKDVYAFGCD